jgi:hypothetical protein
MRINRLAMIAAMGAMSLAGSGAVYAAPEPAPRPKGKAKSAAKRPASAPKTDFDLARIERAERKRARKAALRSKARDAMIRSLA